ncbi:TetR/AcrR family transcriptional regulator [Sorangium atrum]|uniref:TetR/AcrR family transcriptional regulator n=1 Tax=Sorangium atrum TaxID=2995308 RepID=A0ABT5BV62_9BACT|nr:TetR/AcrR family transcriptional regulator [Sorangium aterium]MDC0676836.1 TetR/AcrR family transcriptional regulator [Sorangium aterium]
MARTSRNDWLDQGLDALRDGGEGALTVDGLCARLGRTKGSFYHHFEDIAAFLAALLARWEERQTSAPIHHAEAGGSPEQKRQRLSAVVRSLDGRLELAVRAWALRDVRAAAVLRRVDACRVDYLASLYTSGGSARGAALVLARLEYAAFIGAQMLFSDLSVDGARSLGLALDRALELLAKDERALRLAEDQSATYSMGARQEDVRGKSRCGKRTLKAEPARSAGCSDPARRSSRGEEK